MLGPFQLDVIIPFFTKYVLMWICLIFCHSCCESNSISFSLMLFLPFLRRGYCNTRWTHPQLCCFSTHCCWFIEWAQGNRIEKMGIFEKEHLHLCSYTEVVLVEWPFPLLIPFIVGPDDLSKIIFVVLLLHLLFK